MLHRPRRSGLSRDRRLYRRSRPPDTADLPFAAFGTMDNDVAAANQAAWAFAWPDRAHREQSGRCRRACGRHRLSGGRALQQSALGDGLAADQAGDVAGAADVRQVLGIAPETVPSQVVVNALLRFAAAWQAGDQPRRCRRWRAGLHLAAATDAAGCATCPISSRPTSRSIDAARRDAARWRCALGHSLHQD